MIIKKKKNHNKHYEFTIEIDLILLVSVIIAGVLVFMLREEPVSNHNAELAQEYVQLEDIRKLSSKMFDVVFDVNAHLADKCNQALGVDIVEQDWFIELPVHAIYHVEGKRTKNYFDSIDKIDCGILNI